MTTLDHNSPGNYGLMDVIHVLKFIQKNIREFGGNPDKVTLVGTGSGAGLVGILLVSPKSYDDGLAFFVFCINSSKQDIIVIFLCVTYCVFCISSI